MVIALRSRMRWSVLSVVWAFVIAGSRAAPSNSSRRITDLAKWVERATAGQALTAVVPFGAADPNTPKEDRSAAAAATPPSTTAPREGAPAEEAGAATRLRPSERNSGDDLSGRGCRRRPD